MIELLCLGFVPILLTIWFIVSVIRFLCSGKQEKQVQKRRLIMMIVSASLMTFCFVILIFLYYCFLMAMQQM